MFNTATRPEVGPLAVPREIAALKLSSLTTLIIVLPEDVLRGQSAALRGGRVV
jgi:hypothetical protein